MEQQFVLGSRYSQLLDTPVKVCFLGSLVSVANLHLPAPLFKGSGYVCIFCSIQCNVLCFLQIVLQSQQGIFHHCYALWGWEYYTGWIHQRDRVEWIWAYSVSRCSKNLPNLGMEIVQKHRTDDVTQREYWSTAQGPEHRHLGMVKVSELNLEDDNWFKCNTTGEAKETKAAGSKGNKQSVVLPKRKPDKIAWEEMVAGKAEARKTLGENKSHQMPIRWGI